MKSAVSKLSEHLTLRITHAQSQFLEDLAADQRTSQAAVIRNLLDREARRQAGSPPSGPRRIARWGKP